MKRNKFCTRISEHETRSSSLTSIIDPELALTRVVSVINGEKLYTTNGSIADYFIAYGVSNPSDPPGSMYQVVAEKGKK